jgi:hypothetical protein
MNQATNDAIYRLMSEEFTYQERKSMVCRISIEDAAENIEEALSTTDDVDTSVDWIAIARLMRA